MPVAFVIGLRQRTAIPWGGFRNNREYERLVFVLRYTSLQTQGMLSLNHNEELSITAIKCMELKSPSILLKLRFFVG